MKKQSEFYKVAESIADSRDFSELENKFMIGMCWYHVPGPKTKKNNFLRFYFEGLADLYIPIDYRKLTAMYRLKSFEQTKTFRILALLLADIIWFENNKKVQ